MTVTPVEISRGSDPFPRAGVVRDDAGIAYYVDVPATLGEMLRTHVDARPDAEAVVEVGGDRLTYAQLWERASRVAGGLRAQGVERGDHHRRVAAHRRRRENRRSRTCTRGRPDERSDQPRR